MANNHDLIEIENRSALELFEGQADHYAHEREHLPYFRSQIAILHSMLGTGSGVVLDLGCAAGAEIVDLRSWGFRVVGVDFAEHMLRSARLRFKGDPSVHFCRADLDHLPFSELSVDHIVCLGVFEFLPDYSSPLREICRVLRPGGLAVFAIPSRISLYHVSEAVTGITIGPLWRGVKRLLGRGEVAPGQPAVPRNLCVPWRYRALLRSHSLEPEYSAYSNFFIYPLDRFPSLNTRVAAALEPLCTLPLIRCAASVYLVAARRKK